MDGFIIFLILRLKRGKALNSIELLAPAGNLEKLEVAIHYGADAVYLGGTSFNLRKRAGNFSLKEMKRAIEYAHKKQVKVYVTVNIFARNEDLLHISEYLSELDEIGADAIIVSDPGIIRVAKECVPKLPLHLSTQANTTNWASAKFWEKQGISRINLARECSLKEIKEIKEKTHLEMEILVHGSMCISYAGRCLLSSYMTGRDSNRGDCAQPCRWEYHLVESKRPGQYFMVDEDERGTYIFNSKDLCMIDYIPEMVDVGITTFKIEGRMKSIYYLATVIRIYREAINNYIKDPKAYKCDPRWRDELKKTTHRDFTTGFYIDDPQAKKESQELLSLQNYQFVGKVIEVLGRDTVKIEVKNKLSLEEEVEIIGRNMKTFSAKIDTILSEDGIKKEFGQPNEKIIINVAHPLEKHDLLRKRISIETGCEV
jgi:putative protease